MTTEEERNSKSPPCSMAIWRNYYYHTKNALRKNKNITIPCVDICEMPNMGWDYHKPGYADSLSLVIFRRMPVVAVCADFATNFENG